MSLLDVNRIAEALGLTRLELEVPMPEITQVLKTVEALVSAILDAQDTQAHRWTTPAKLAERIHRLRLLLNLELQELAKGPDPARNPAADPVTRPRRRG